MEASVTNSAAMAVDACCKATHLVSVRAYVRGAVWPRASSRERWHGVWVPRHNGAQARDIAGAPVCERWREGARGRERVREGARGYERVREGTGGVRPVFDSAWQVQPTLRAFVWSCAFPRDSCS